MRSFIEKVFGIHLHKWNVTYGAFGEPLQRVCKCGAKDVSSINLKWVRVKL